MSLSDEFTTETTETIRGTRSKVTVFIETLNKKDRADFDEWLKAPSDKGAMYRVLKRRGLDVAYSTFRNWTTGL